MNGDGEVGIGVSSAREGSVGPSPSGLSTATAPASDPPLTILTVGIEKHYSYIARQIEMIDALNRGAQYRFLVVDNAALGTPRMVIDDARCEVVAGIDASPLPEEGRGSYHHAAALNMAIRRVKTRFALVIDPDLFVVYRDWISECLEHMHRRNLSFFGVPWHSRWYRKWRGFPCVHFLLIDLSKVSAGEIDFTPALVEDLAQDAGPTATWMKAHMPLFYNRMLIETRRDTGWRLHHRFARRHAVELALPVVDLDAELAKPKHLTTERGRWFERRMPARWSFLPARGSYIDSSDAPGFDNRPFRELGPEKFVWRGAPFAFHMRRNVRDEVFGRQDQDLEQGDLAAILGQLPDARPWTEWAF